MNVERGTFEGEETPEDRATADACIEAAFAKLRHNRASAHLFAPEDEDTSLARAKADIAAGHFVPHEDVAAWLKTVGTPDFKPMPREWLE